MSSMVENLGISAHSAAAAIARDRVASGVWTAEQALEFTEWVCRSVNTGEVPNDFKLLGLADNGGWKICSSGGGEQVADGFELSV